MSVEEYINMVYGEAFKLPVEGEAVGGFEDVLGKPYTLNNKRAVNTIERVIFVDTRGSQAKGIYKDMFFYTDQNPNSFNILNRNLYHVYSEYTTTPSQNTTLSSMYNGSVMGQVSSQVVNKVKVEQFGITSPRTTDGWYYEEVEKGVFKKITNDFFTKDKTVRYWAEQIESETTNDPISGRTDDGIRYYYEIIK